MRDSTSIHGARRLLVFPAIQLVSLVMACSVLPDNPLLVAVLVAVAALALNFSVHVCFHEWIHQHRSPELGPLAFTLLSGTPFDGYRLHHQNHHFHENGPGDYSSTWSFGAEGRKPRGVAGESRFCTEFDHLLQDVRWHLSRDKLGH